MARAPQRTRREIKDALLEVELTARRVEIARQLVLLAVTVALAVVAIVCALHGYRWPAFATGGSSGLTAAVSARVDRRDSIGR
jgi:hypothetical protein